MDINIIAYNDGWDIDAIVISTDDCVWWLPICQYPVFYSLNYCPR